ncbi:unnamed protein product [Diamesa serratosioi]
MAQENTLEVDWKLFRELSCGCALQKRKPNKCFIAKNNIKQQPLRCPHKKLVSICPTYGKLKAQQTAQLAIALRYQVLGQHKITYSLVLSGFTLKLNFLLDVITFDPCSLLVANKLAPVAIDNLYPPLQTLWLYNPYLNEVKLNLTSMDSKLTIINDTIVIASHCVEPLLLRFSPNSIKYHNFSVGIEFNECISYMDVKAQCIGTAKDLLHNFYKQNSPNFDLATQQSPFVMHGDNIIVILLQNSISITKLISLQNNSKNCIKYQWDTMKLTGLSCEISVKPHCGYLKAGFTKLFQVSVTSYGFSIMMKMISIKCRIFKYSKEAFLESTMPEGYFEYTENGFYEKPHNWTPNCLEFLQCLNVNVNIRVLNNFELGKYVERCQKSMDKQEMEVLKEIFYQYCDQRLNLLPIINYSDPSCGREELMMEKITSLVFMNNYQLEQTFHELLKEQQYVETISCNKSENPLDEIVGNINEQKLLISKIINDALFNCITDISKEHRFIPPGW